MERLWKNCGKVVKRLWVGCGGAVKRLWRGCGEAVERFWKGCGEVVERLWSCCGEPEERLLKGHEGVVLNDSALALTHCVALSCVASHSHPMHLVMVFTTLKK